MEKQALAIEKRSVTHGTFVIERNYPASPEKVFAALADPAKKQRWYAAEGNGSTVESFEMDFRVGGNDHTVRRFKEGSPFPGTTLENHTNYQDIVPNKRVVFAYTMTLGEKRISASLGTFELVPAGKGTNVIFTDQGAYFEGADGPKMREQGWGVLLDGLAKELAQS